VRRTRSPPPAVAELYTVGHSNHAIEHFLALLRRHGVETVADVRSRPYSRFVPHFGKERLALFLEAQGLGYLFLGQELGGKPPIGEANAPALTYQVRVAQPEFRQGVDRLLRAVGTNRVALLCRERDPLECHRFHLICRYLRPQGLDIRHILPTGEAERQPATERRLLERTAKGQLGLFDDPGQAALERAYDDWWRVRGP
jgi:uncharacterized protein (DUF488 family)